MSTNPAGTLITIGSSTLIVDSLTATTAVEPFDRMEFANQTVRNSRTAKGQKAIMGETMSGMPYQFVFNCGSETPALVPLGPDTITNLQKVKKKWIITRYQVNGAMSVGSAADALLSLAIDHQNRLAKFQFHLAKATWDIPYPDLIAMQSETFSYITATGISASGPALGTTVPSILVTNATVNNDLVIPTSGSYEYYKTWSVTFETRSIANLDAV